MPSLLPLGLSGSEERVGSRREEGTLLWVPAAATQSQKAEEKARVNAVTSFQDRSDLILSGSSHHGFFWTW